LSELAQWYKAHSPKGEIVLVVAGLGGHFQEIFEEEKEEEE
jgi:16S rRNA C1402 (ribose-2'-O) methylase RsmI